MKNKRHILLLLLMLLPYFNNPCESKGKWEKIESSKETKIEKYYKLIAADSLNLVILVDCSRWYNRIRQTYDGGQTWFNSYKDTAFYNDTVGYHAVPVLQDIAYPNKKLIIAVGDSGLILRSTDNGFTWNKHSIDSNIQIIRIFMANENYGIIQCEKYVDPVHGFDLETTDGGLTWDSTLRKKNIGYWQINFINENLFYSLGWFFDETVDYTLWNKHIFKVRDKWSSFDTLPFPEEAQYLKFVDEDNGWMSGSKLLLDSAGWQRYSQIIRHTSDGGKTWVTQRDTVYKGIWLYDVNFYDKNFGMTGSFFGLMLITTDGGKNWIQDTVEDCVNCDFDHVQIPTSTTAYLIANSDYIYKYTRDTTTEVSETKERIDRLVFPNPAGDYINISIGANGCSPESVKIFDVFGQEYLTPTLSTSGEGVRIDVSALSPGVYFVRVGSKVSKFIKY